jgi:hypothetical protein
MERTFFNSSAETQGLTSGKDHLSIEWLVALNLGTFSMARGV